MNDAAESVARASEPGGGALRRISFAAKLAATVLALVLVARLVDPAAMMERLRNINPWLLGIGLAVMVAQIPLLGLRWRLIVRAMSAPKTVVPGALKFQQVTYIAQF